MKSDKVPKARKEAYITPLLKKPTLDSNDINNYRPIANLQSDVFNSLVMYVPIVVVQLFSNHVGSESESHGCVEDELIALRTSSTVTDSRFDHVDVLLFEYDRLSADSVAARMSVVFLSMTSWYCSMVKHVSALSLFSPSNVFMCRQIRHDLPC